MLPSRAIPSAPPSSVPVSDSPEATPARSGGTAPTIWSVARVTTGETPTASRTEPVTRTASPAPPLPGSQARAARPAAAIASPDAIVIPAPRRRATAGGELGAGDEPGRRRHGPPTCRQRRQPEHQLQVLGGEEEGPEDQEQADRVGRQGRDKGRCPEQAQVDQRRGQVALAAQERGPGHQPGQERE